MPRHNCGHHRWGPAPVNRVSVKNTRAMLLPGCAWCVFPLQEISRFDRSIPTAACGFANEGPFFERIPTKHVPSFAKPQAAEREQSHKTQNSFEGASSHNGTCVEPSTSPICWGSRQQRWIPPIGRASFRSDGSTQTKNRPPAILWSKIHGRIQSKRAASSRGGGADWTLCSSCPKRIERWPTSCPRSSWGRPKWSSRC